jgi:hypothetical protein
LEILLQKYPKALFIFFLLEQKETKSQGKRPTPIGPGMPSQNGGSLSFAKISRTITNVCSNSIHIYSLMKIKARMLGNDFVQQ